MNGLSLQPENQAVFPTDYFSIITKLKKIDPAHYGKTRNFIDGAITYMSPYISRGVVSVKQVKEAVLANGYTPASSEKFLQELAWREYFQRVWQAKGDLLFQDIKQPQLGVWHHQMIEAIVDAKTGISAIDKLILEFYESGYMHNHVRMYVASLACNIGRAHWSSPAKWMYYHLLDGDLASNTCSWQWVAGAFSAKKYYCNQDNINRHTRSNQLNTFLDTAVENLPHASVPDGMTATVPLTLETVLPSLPSIYIDTTKSTAIYNSYNLDPLWRKEEDVNRVLLLEPSHFQKFPVSENVVNFIIALSKNIAGLQLMVGEISDLVARYGNAALREEELISKEHPAFAHYPGIKDDRDWMFPAVTGYYPSFFSFWKECEKQVV